MRVEIANQTGGGIQFVLHAESEAEELVLGIFQKQAEANTVAVHGFTRQGRERLAPGPCGERLGPSSFNFGTVPKGPSLVTGSFTPEQKAEVERLLREARTGKAVLIPEARRGCPYRGRHPSCDCGGEGGDR